MNRTAARAEAAAALAGAVGRVGSAADVAGADLVVQATPVGMARRGGGSDGRAPRRPRRAARGARWWPTSSTTRARRPCWPRRRRAGAVAVGGLGMLVHQAALALEQWTGRAAPVEAMWARGAGPPPRLIERRAGVSDRRPRCPAPVGPAPPPPGPPGRRRLAPAAAAAISWRRMRATRSRSLVAVRTETRHVKVSAAMATTPHARGGSRHSGGVVGVVGHRVGPGPHGVEHGVDGGGGRYGHVHGGLGPAPRRVGQLADLTVGHVPDGAVVGRAGG